MKKLFFSLFGLFAVLPAFAATSTFKCGPGYVLGDHAKIDGMKTQECRKLWCRDLENNNRMGSGNKVASGYQDVLSEVSDSSNNSIECFGDRKWCSGESAGIWNPNKGIYVRAGDEDGSTYKAVQKGSCFAWRLVKPVCRSGETAMLKDGEWICATSNNSGVNTILKSSVRRTGAVRRLH